MEKNKCSKCNTVFATPHRIKLHIENSVLCSDNSKITLEGEEWKEIEGFNNYYISTYGRVYSKINERIISEKYDEQKRYCVVTFRNNDNIKSSISVHRIVAITFIPNTENKQYVNHKDGNKKNNNVTNLEWVTHKENMQHCILTGLRGKTNNQGTKIEYIDESNNKIEFNTLQEASTHLKLSIPTITKILRKEDFTTSKMFTKICIFDKEDNLVKKCENNSEAIEFLKITPDKLRKILNNQLIIDDYNLRYVTTLPNIKEIKFENEDIEEWKDIPDLENYDASSEGRIRNKARNKILEGSIKEGYVYVVLNKTYLLHRLIAQTFVENPENKPFVNHKDRNRSNNKITNLEWVTQEENCKHAKDTKPIIDNKKHCGICKEYKEIDKFYKDATKWGGLSSSCKDCILKKVKCICGAEVTSISMNKHLHSKKHTDYLNSHQT